MRIGGAGLVCIPLVLLAQQRTDTSEQGRELLNEGFKASRARSPATASRPATHDAGNVRIGVTLWRMRPSTEADQVRDRGLGHHLKARAKPSSEEWSPVRIPLDTELKPGEWIRLSIENTRKGHLYVLDADVFDGDSYRNPKLIFPTISLRRGDNAIAPGFLLELPQWSDDPPAFEIESVPGQKGIEVVVILSPTPLDGVTPMPEAQPVSAGFYHNWRAAGKKAIRRNDPAAQPGTPYTIAERDAATAVHQLAPRDPMPATEFHSLAGPAEPAVAVIQLRIAK